ncbi:MAG: hypothetical protein IPG74_16845 [Flavobacteriales bacterium]|mgnify:CR=1 FL=1|nr:hypothetical protein [Flavobacteriales bacterium]MBK7555101.1 hypothetical protein [Flavobacteriales bacterium]MBK9196085.1 hypothetical protein [Flavobacteriales bacterium]MBP6574130.1 hypothetical protein [Flavobacteriales bacterium]
METKIILAYIIYLPVALGLTFYVARTLFTNGRTFMLDIFKGKEDIANATNKLFEVGFYLLNMGFALLILRIDQGELVHYTANAAGEITRYRDALDTNQEVVEVLARKLGGFAIYLGVMLFLNLYLFFRGRKKARQNAMLTPPIPVVVAPVR